MALTEIQLKYVGCMAPFAKQVPDLCCTACLSYKEMVFFQIHHVSGISRDFFCSFIQQRGSGAFYPRLAPCQVLKSSNNLSDDSAF